MTRRSALMRLSRARKRTVVGYPGAGSIRAGLEDGQPRRCVAAKAVIEPDRMHREPEPENGCPATGLAPDRRSP